MIVAHVFLTPYTLPVPFWLYVYGCAATLVLSFALLAYLASSGLAAAEGGRREIPPGAALSWLGRRVLDVLRAASVAALVMTIAAGVLGPSDPSLNVGMTLFWVWFLLACVYLSVLAGNVYEWINPWASLAEGLHRAGLDMDARRLRYPHAAGYWPAVILYLALVWIELFLLPRPSSLAIALVAYTAIALGGMYLFGRAAWLRHGELFAVFFRVVGSLAPIEYLNDRRAAAEPAARKPQARGRQALTSTIEHIPLDSNAPCPDQSVVPVMWSGYPRVAVRWPLAGALEERADHGSLVVFILFMLSSTTYDTIHGTYLWISIYWQRLLPLLQPLWGTDVVSAQAALTTGYWWYQWLGLLLSPAFYLALYLGVLTLAIGAARAAMSLRSLSNAFAFSLVPIAVAYHATHYFPSMWTELRALLPQLADPLARGWRLPIVSNLVAATPPPMALIWHAQVVVLLAGHVAGVYLAHVAALRVFPTRRQGLASQLPMLALMVGYTCLGLWVLSLPLGVPQSSLLPAG